MEKYSLKPVLPVLEKHLGMKVLFADDCLGESAINMTKELKPGEVLLLENVRFYPEEEGVNPYFRKRQLTTKRKLPRLNLR